MVHVFTANIDKTQVNINSNVKITELVCPPGQNSIVEIIFTRPDYTYVEQYSVADSRTGNFSFTQKLDMIGY
jgi:hypothetical protein